VKAAKLGLVSRLGVVLGLAAFACSSSKSTGPAPPPGPTPPALMPGEICDTTNTAPLNVLLDRAEVEVAPGQTRTVRVSVEPDLCSPGTLSFATGDPTIAAAPASARLDLRHPTWDVAVSGGATGTTTITATMTRSDGSTSSATLPVVVMDPTPVACTPADAGSGQLSASTYTLGGSGNLSAASLAVPPGAFARTDWLSLSAFTAKIACDADLTAPMQGGPPGLVPISPAVNFSTTGLSMTQSLRRELDFAIPVNPAAIPPAGRLRHLQVLFKGGALTPKSIATAPRVMTVANPRIEQVQGSSPAVYVLRFSSPWFGTYQAAFAPDAGTQHRTRRLVHRAVLGFSMGSGGAATFGMRHHDKFDVIAPLGGPSDWNWLGWYVEKYALGGFCPANQPNCPKYAPDAYPLSETYAHTMDWNHWFYEVGGGNGGTFSRGEYTQIFEDLALMAGNPNGQNADPKLSFFAAGPTASDGWVSGGPTIPASVYCPVTVDPIKNDPNMMQQQQTQQQCTLARCDPMNTWKAPAPYYDAEYNPDGSKQVISFCDGNDNGTSPYVDTWVAPTPATEVPVDLVLAVDLNRNGVRDMNEPVLRQGHEPWQDTGTDGLFDAQEPGYDAVNNPDPNQDDYDFQINPNGTENDHHHEMSEPYQDVGLDGVAGTKQLSQGGYDYGEGDGMFTQADGLVNFAKVDPHNILHQWVTGIPAGPMTDQELLRFNVWSDGGVRDLFNFAAVANHLEGAIASRLGSNGLQLRTTAFYNGFHMLPGQDPTQPDHFDAKAIRWPDLVDSPGMRYGTIDATATQIAQGDGQHVGTASQLLDRLESGLYFAAQHWPDADRTDTQLTSMNPESTTVNVLGTACEIAGKCVTTFTGPKTGRTGPIAVQLPPGYALAENVQRNVRYPVVFVLHGYGQEPTDLEAVAIVSTNFMNDELRSSATRLAKFIIVYVDGRCRISADGHTPECIRGTFYLDSNRPEGAHIDSWFDELLDYMDQNYRTLAPSDIDVVE
jgi:hypothetical protein